MLRSNVANEPVMGRGGRPAEGRERRGEFVRLYAELRPQLTAYVRSLVPNVCDAEDVLQEIGVVLWSKFGGFSVGSDFERWAFRIARLQVLCYFKRRQRDVVRFSDEFVEQIAEMETVRPEVSHASEALRQCIGKLGTADRELFRRRYETSGVTARQVARDLGKPESTVFNALSRIRRRLLECVRRSLGDS